ncbi:MAG: ferritin-like domain-containing protein [Nitrospira sp.]|nr:ferritin-like domain-containing protein [Nitrospira sp.]
MLVRPDEKVPMARLLTFLEHGERMAHDCAKAQAALAEDSGTRHFLLSQAKQEAMHARVFQGAIVWLAPKHLCDVPFLPALEAYRRIIDDALARRDLMETFLAEQVVLEGLGEAILTRIEQGLVKRAAPFGPLRRILLKQEEAHHGFGRRQIGGAIKLGKTDEEDLRQRTQQYLGLTDAMVLALGDLLDSIDEDATAWAHDVRTFLPVWCSA